MQKYEWLLFDLDNTILDFNASSEIAFFLVFKNMGVELDKEDLNIYMDINKELWARMEEGGYSHEELKTLRWKLFLKARGLTGDPALINQAYFDKIIEYPVFVKGAKEILDGVINNYKLGLITNGLGEVQRPRLKNSNLAKYFDCIVISDEIGMAKPQKSYFDYTADKIGNPSKDQILVIGDNLNTDIIGGKQYGYDTCWYDYYKKGPSKKVIPKYHIEEMEQLVEIL